MYVRPKSLGFVVNQTSRLMQRVMRFQLNMRGMQPAFVPVLLWLMEEDGLTQMDLSRRIAVEQASMAQLLKRMETEGFIERRQDKNDLRKQSLHLTARARRVYPKIQQWLEANNATAIVGISERDLTTCFSVLEQIIGNLEAQLPADLKKIGRSRERKE